jgi:hypothetical protein
MEQQTILDQLQKSSSTPTANASEASEQPVHPDQQLSALDRESIEKELQQIIKRNRTVYEQKFSEMEAEEDKANDQ